MLAVFALAVGCASASSLISVSPSAVAVGEVFHVIGAVDCGEGLAISALTDATGTNEDCVQLDDAGQLWDCAVRLTSADGSSFTVATADSNIVEVSVQTGDVAGEFSVESGSDTALVFDADGGIVDLHWSCSTCTHGVVHGGSGSPVTVMQDGEVLKIHSLSFEADAWHFTVKAQANSALSLTLNDGVAYDVATMAAVPTHTNLINVLLDGEAELQDCVMSAWSAWSACTETCAGHPSEDGPGFDLDSGFTSRSRTILTPAGGQGLPCESTEETSSCSDLPVCNIGSRPTSGEHDGLCQGPGLLGSAERCFATDPFGSSTFESAGCSCAQDCLVTGNCCQAFFKQNCCPQGDCEENYSEFVYKGVFPLQCEQKDCYNSNVHFQDVIPRTSYYCWCDAQCLIDDSCCGGSDARKAVCN